MVLSVSGGFLSQKPVWARELDHRFRQDTEDLSQGDAVVRREANQYEGQILIPAQVDAVWSVLTDYDNFSAFMPGVVENRVERQPASIVMETKSVTSVLLARINSTVAMRLSEDPQSRIAFDLISSDSLESLSGSWQLEVMQDLEEQVLLTYQAEAVTESVPKGLFAGVFTRQIRLNLMAIRDEVLRRQGS